MTTKPTAPPNRQVPLRSRFIELLPTNTCSPAIYHYPTLLPAPSLGGVVLDLAAELAALALTLDDDRPASEGSDGSGVSTPRTPGTPSTISLPLKEFRTADSNVVPKV